jgi:hypothetical protein
MHLLPGMPAFFFFIIAFFGLIKISPHMEISVFPLVVRGIRAGISAVFYIILI